MVSAGLCCVLWAAAPPASAARLGLALVGKLGVAAAWAVLFMYAAGGHRCEFRKLPVLCVPVDPVWKPVCACLRGGRVELTWPGDDDGCTLPGIWTIWCVQTC